MKKNANKCCPSITNYVLRIAVGGLLLVMSIAKFKMGIGTFAENMSGMFESSIIPVGFAVTYLTLVPLAEVILGGLLILGLFTRIAAAVAAFLFALFVVGLASTGDPANYTMITNNFIYTFASLWLVCRSCAPISLDYVVSKGKCDM